MKNISIFYTIEYFQIISIFCEVSYYNYFGNLYKNSYTFLYMNYCVKLNLKFYSILTHSINLEIIKYIESIKFI